MRKLTKNSKGFTLIELILVIVVLGIISAVAVPKIGNTIRNAKINTTKDEMMKLKIALIGDAEVRVGAIVINKGYRGDMAMDPAAWADLVNAPADPDLLYNRFTRMGWNGPYIEDDGELGFSKDSWDREYELIGGYIVSKGPDETDPADDIKLKYIH
ncbi:Tfp pilus assembly protein FimT/FimU [candidate division KSB1 bacterium]